MIYKKFQDLQLSALGLGTMRFPTLSQDPAAVDMEKTREIVDCAIKNGINYFDTAWFYHAGESEPIMGKILADYPRDSFYLASKFPGYEYNFGCDCDSNKGVDADAIAAIVKKVISEMK